MGGCNKFTLLMINLTVFVVGIAVVGMASLIISKYETYKGFHTSGVFSALPIVIIIAVLLILLNGFLVCCGLLKENSWKFQMYAGIFLILIIPEIALGILILDYPNKVEETIMKCKNETYYKYLECCGVRSTNSSIDGCCKIWEPKCGNDILLLKPIQIEEKIYKVGCYELIKDDIAGTAIWLGVVCIILVQVLSISCASGIIKKSKQYV